MPKTPTLAALTVLAALAAACEPYDILAPGEIVDPGSGGMPAVDPPPDAPPSDAPPPDAPPPDVPPPIRCVPERPWRRPGGGGGTAGHDADWRLSPLDPEGWDEEGTEDRHTRYDACRRVTSTTRWYGCIDGDFCEGTVSSGAAYDAQGNLVTEIESWSTFVRMDHASITIDHRYDEGGARVSTWAVDTNDRPAEAYIVGRRFQNDAEGRVLTEEVRHFAEEWDQIGQLVRRSTFAYDDARGEITESVDEGADGSVDAILTW